MILGAYAYNQAETEKRLNAWYSDGIAAASREDWDIAVNDFAAILRSSSAYRDTAQRLDAARHQQELKQHYDAAMALYRQADWAAAVPALEAVLREDANFKDADVRLSDARRELAYQQRFDAAMALAQQGEYDRAILELDAIARSDSVLRERARTEAYNVRYSRAESYAAKKYYNIAISGFEDVAGPESPIRDKARIALGDARFAQAQDALDHKDFERAVKLFDDLAAADLPAKDRAKVAASGARQKYGDDLVGRATDAVKARHLPEAEAYARQAVALNGRNPKARYMLGSVLSERRQYTDAREHLQQAILLDPGSATGYSLLGWTWLNGRPTSLDEADRAFRKAIELNGKYASPHAGLGQVLLQRGDTAAARSEFETAINIDPDEAAAYQGFGHLFFLAKDFGTAEANLRKAVEKAPTRVVFHLDLADVLVKRNAIEAGIAELEAAKALAPDDPYVDWWAGDFYVSAKNYGRALTAFDDAIAKKADDARFHTDRATVLFLLERDAEALDATVTSLMIEETADAHVVRGYIFRAQGRLGDARDEARRALDIDPKSESARELLK